MSLKFEKYHGTGNDFIIIDNRNGQFPSNTTLIQKLCDRHFGIGSDGLILIEKDLGADFNMIFFNPDGSQSFCGNGSRCAVQYAFTNELISRTGSFKGIDGIHKFKIIGNAISIKMGDVKEIFNKGNDFFVDTGSPHYIRFVDDVANFDIVGFGKSIRYSEDFIERNGTNVNAIEVIRDNSIGIATYERGVENETMSCGTGVTACALIHGMHANVTNVDVKTKGGDLRVSFKKIEGGFSDIWLSGPAVRVFGGEI